MSRDLMMEVLLEWNNWEGKGKTGIARGSYLAEIRRKIAAGEVLVIGGVRRCGKSTLARQFMEGRGDAKNSVMINFEDVRLAGMEPEGVLRMFEAYLSEIQPEGKPLLVLDEVQNVKGWERLASQLHEMGRADIIVTGSSSKLLSGEYATLLTGRHLDVRAFPLSFREYLGFCGIEMPSRVAILKNKARIMKLAREYLEFGGFPKAALTADTRLRIELLAAYYDDIIHKDIAKRHSIMQIRKLDDLAKFFLSNNSRLMSLNKAKNVVGLSLDSVERFSRHMEDAYLVFFAPIFSYSKKVQIVNPKKVYSIDTGLRNAVCFRFSKDYGWNAENAVFLDAVRRGYKVHYHSDGKTECDIIALKGKERLAIQVSWELKDEVREIAGLVSAMKTIKAREGWLVAEDAEEERKAGKMKIHIVPLWKWLLREE